MSEKSKVGRPKGSFAWGARMCATIADEIALKYGISIEGAARAALDATYYVSRDKLNWREGSDKAAVELVRQTVHKIRKNPASKVYFRPGLKSYVLAHIEKQIHELQQTKNHQELEGEEANARRTQRKIDKLNEPVKEAQAFAESQERDRTSLHAIARERGVELSSDEIKQIEAQQKEALRRAVAANSLTPKPFATTKKKT